MEKGIWHKRFRKDLHPAIREFTDSTQDDENLVGYEIKTCIAHVQMLEKCRIIKKNEANAIQKALKKLLKDHKAGKFKMHSELEDVHVNIEKAVKKIAGRPAEKLHTARSRNDLIATDLRLYAREQAKKIIQQLNRLQKQLSAQARKNPKTVFPGFTHLRPAQPITWSFYMHAQISRFARDIDCLRDALKRINISPLGSAAIAGTNHPINPKITAKKLEFDRAAKNALDAVSDRDFIAELMYVCSQIGIHIASLCEDIIIYSSPDFDLIELDDSITTGSSIMPQKKNPDLFEILRAKSGNAIGNLCSILTMLKGLPSAYNRDLQETKSVFFRQVDETISCLEVLAIGIARLKVKEKDWVHQPSFICATRIVDYLVKKGMAFRQAYNMVADCVARSNHNVYLFIKECSKRSQIDEQTINKLITPKNQTK